jgi:hypothetical protein
MVPIRPVPLELLLNRIRALHDLQELVASIGHAPVLAWLPHEGWVDHEPPRRAAVVGRRGTFEWLAFETGGAPTALAERLARRLERGARLTGIMVLCPSSRLLALSVSLPPRPVLLVDLANPSPLSLSCLERLAGPEDPGDLATAALVARSLDGEATGRRFFTAFRTTLRRAAGTLPVRMPEPERHAAA